MAQLAGQAAAPLQEDGADLKAQAAWESGLRRLQEQWTAVAADAERAAKAEALGGWSTWVEEALKGGAGRAHRFARPRVEKKLQRVVILDGMPHCDPLSRMEAACEKFCRIWGAVAEDPGPFEELRRLNEGFLADLPAISPADIPKAARSVSGTTPRSYDGLHPRHYGLLSGHGLSAAAALCTSMKRIGHLPRPAHWTQ